MSTQILKNWDQIDTIKDKWNDLLKQSEADSIFLTWEWINSWRKASNREISPYVIVVENSSREIIGIVPLHLKTYQLLGVIGFKTLHIMADSATGAEYPDIIAMKEHEDDICSEVGRVLKDDSANWDCLWLPRIAGWSNAENRWHKVIKSGKFLFHQRKHTFSCIDLPQNQSDFYNVLSKNRKSQLKRQTNKVIKSGQIEISECLQQDEVQEYLSTLFELHNKRWRSNGMKGAFERKADEQRFYELFAPIALANGWLKIYSLKIDGQTKAIQLGYIYNNVFNQLQEGFDPDFIEGVGNVLRKDIMDICLRNRVEKYDFLGEHTEHKRRWNSEPRFGKDIFAGNGNLKTRLLFLKNIWPTGRYLNLSD